MLIPNWLARAAAQAPQRVALIAAGVPCTYAELEQAATTCASEIAALHIQPGSRIGLLARNGLPFATVVHALMQLDAILVPLNARLTPAEIAWQMLDAGCALLLYDDAHAAMADAIARDVTATGQRHRLGAGLQVMAMVGAPTDAPTALLPATPLPMRATIDLAAPQAIIYTSGTTGRPKGAIITYGMQYWSALGSLLNLGHQRDDRWLAVLPFFHVGGLAILMRAVITMTSVVIHERFDAAAVNAAIRAHEVTLISVVTVMLQRLLADLDTSGAALPTLRAVLLGGGPAPAPLLRACADRALPVLQTYGMTESCSQAVTLPPEDSLRKLGSAGLPLGSVEIAIWRDGTPAPVGTDGEIMLRGPTITPGYWNRPDANAAAFTDGWFASGDIGRRDADGYLYVLDRRDDLIIAGGENIYPAEIEAALLAHPAVAEAGVRGAPDARWGQAPVAYIVPAPGQTVVPAEVAAFLADRLAKYKLPTRIIVVDALPRNGAGKLLRRELPVPEDARDAH